MPITTEYLTIELHITFVKENEWPLVPCSTSVILALGLSIHKTVTEYLQNI